MLLPTNPPAHRVADVVAEEHVLPSVEAGLPAVHDRELGFFHALRALRSSRQLLAAAEHGAPRQRSHREKTQRERWGGVK